MVRQGSGRGHFEQKTWASGLGWVTACGADAASSSFGPKLRTCVAAAQLAEYSGGLAQPRGGTPHTFASLSCSLLICNRCV